MAELKSDLMEKLLSIPKAKKISNKEIALRCPFCGDSRRDPNKTRFYINIDTENNKPILYYCFNCPAHGILTPDVLRLLELSDLSLNGELLRYNKNSNKGSRISGKRYQKNIRVPKYSISEKSQKKCDYINSRLGLNYNVDYWTKFKIIFDLEEFMKLNKKIEFGFNDREKWILDNYYVMFITSKNDYLISRNITDKGQRYKKTPIFKNNDNSFKFYSIPNQIDILTTNTININIAEGTFDILGVFHNVRNREVKDNIYVSVTGSGYKSVIYYILSEGIVNNVSLNIYSDSDKDVNYYKEQLKDYLIWFQSVKVIYNTLYKDFGVPKDMINQREVIIK
ncbi:MAG: hypothetical protein PHF63_00610 [Herbinix sp.]|nr:hypothetical protein [Herbinix sp.]